MAKLNNGTTGTTGTTTAMRKLRFFFFQGKVNNSSMTVIRFEYEGNYSKKGGELKWIPRECKMYCLLINTSIEDVTYSGLVDNICRKMKVDESTTKLTISYILPLCKNPTYIMDDEDVLCYLMEANENQSRIFLNVQPINVVDQYEVFEEREGFEQNQGVELVSRVNKKSVVASNDVSVGGMITLYSSESSQQCELLENVGNAYAENVDNVDIVETFEDIEVTPQDVTPRIYMGDEAENPGWEDGLPLTIHQEFVSKETLKYVIEKGAHLNCFEFDIIKSDTKRYVVKCGEAKKGCKWHIRAAKLKNSDCLSVRTYNNIHMCSRASSSTSEHFRKGTPRLVASVLQEDYPGKLDTPKPKTIIDIVQGTLGIKVSYSTALRGKKKAASDVRGSPEESYKLIYSYMYMLEQKNPGTVTHVVVDEEHKFKYLFFALGACIEGFQAMRKVIIVDGTHIKTVHGGLLIVATAQDPDHHHYPIAFGVVDGEKDASLTWFFSILKTVVPDGPEMVFVSDRSERFINSIREVYPLSQHGCCVYHLSQNVKASVSHVNKKKVGQKFMECAKAYTEAEFNKLYGDFRKKYPAAAVYLDKSVEVKKWARCYFPGERYNIDTTNSVESINGIFKDARGYSLLSMIDAIIEKLAEWFNKYRKIAALNPHELVPLLETELHTLCSEAKHLKVFELNSYRLEYMVDGRDGNTYLVDLRRKTCCCKHFDIDKYPCVHAIAAAKEAKKEAEPNMQLHELCSKYYLMENWVLAYYKTIFTVPHSSQWVIPDHIRDLVALPPNYVKKRGRLQVRRFPSVGEHRRRKNKGRAESLHEWFDNNDTGGN